MDLRASVLIAAALLFLAAASPAGAASTCRACHGMHAPERGSCVACHRGIEGTRRKEVAHHDLVPGRLLRYRIPGDSAVERGAQWIERAACRRCHTLGGTGNRLAADLDRTADGSPNRIVAALLEPSAFMPAFGFGIGEASEIVNAILAGRRREAAGRTEIPTTVRFTDEGEREEVVFVRRCGRCHRALTRRLGVLGKGSAGPNLSGLLGRFYPAPFPDRRPMTAERLRRWLDNPRSERRDALMPPVNLPPAEFRELLSTLRDDGALRTEAAPR